MTLPITKLPISQLVDKFVTDRLAALAAYREQDIPRHNRWHDCARAAADELLSRGEAGRAEIEKLMRHVSPSVRVAAASYVLKWSPNEAVPVLEKILLWADEDRTEGLFGESLHVGGGAAGLLAQYYHLSILDIRDFVRTKHGLPPKARSREPL
jgi:HEAT repeat protein